MNRAILQEDVFLRDRLPEFAHIDNFRFVMDTAPPFYTNGTATARHPPTERDAWNADVDARKAARRVRRARQRGKP